MDTIGNMLTAIRNASAARRETVRVPFSSQKQRIVDVLRRSGYIGPVSKFEENNKAFLEITLLYDDSTPVIQGIKRVSVPSRRWYVRKDEIPRVLSGLGIAVLSTSNGIMTNKEARKQGLGGEVICEVW